METHSSRRALSCLRWQVMASERLAVHNLPAIVTMLHRAAHALDHLHGKGLIHGPLPDCPSDDCLFAALIRAMLLRGDIKSKNMMRLERCKACKDRVSSSSAAYGCTCSWILIDLDGSATIGHDLSMKYSESAIPPEYAVSHRPSWSLCSVTGSVLACRWHCGHRERMANLRRTNRRSKHTRPSTVPHRDDSFDAVQ